MTAVIHHGPPGSFKTFTLVQRVMIPALQAGRVVVTNVRGFNDLNRISSALGITFPDTAAIFYLQPDTQGYEHIARFFHWVPAGALIVMDEGQRVYPLRKKSFDYLDQPDNIVLLDSQNKPLIDIETSQPICRPATLENAIDQHRHFNWDIYISTTNVAKIHGEIRKAVEWAFRHRDNTGLLPWWKNSWTEFRHDSEQSGKSVSHYSGTPKRYKADMRIYDCYQSTATGKAKVSNESLSVFRDPRFRLALILIVTSVSGFIYFGIDAYNRLFAPRETPASVALVDDPTSAVQARNMANNDAAVVDAPAARPTDAPDVNPLSGLTIYFVGTINGSPLFEVQFGEDQTSGFNAIEMAKLGYRIRQVSRTVVALDIGGKTVFALPKPSLPIESTERVATMERSATGLELF